MVARGAGHVWLRVDGLWVGVEDCWASPYIYIYIYIYICTWILNIYCTIYYITCICIKLSIYIYIYSGEDPQTPIRLAPGNPAISVVVHGVGLAGVLIDPSSSVGSGWHAVRVRGITYIYWLFYSRASAELVSGSVVALVIKLMERYTNLRKRIGGELAGFTKYLIYIYIYI